MWKFVIEDSYFDYNKLSFFWFIKASGVTMLFKTVQQLIKINFLVQLTL